MTKNVYYKYVIFYLLLFSILCTTLLLMPSQSIAGENATEGVEGMLQKRMRAFRDNDENAFRKTIDERATPEFRESQIRRFAGLRSVQFSSYSLHPIDRYSGNLANGLKLKEKYGANEALLVETRETYRFADYDDRDAQNTYWYTYVRRGNTWTVIADSDAEVFGLRSARTIWDNGPVIARNTPHFFVIATTAKQHRVDEVAALAERAYGVFARRWSESWSQRVPLLIPDDNAQAAALIGSPDDLTKFAALTTYLPQRDEGWRPLASRIILQDDVVGSAPQEAVQSTLVHELTHAAMSQFAGIDTPHWLQEGIAMAVQRDAHGSYTPTRKARGIGESSVASLPRDDEFFDASSDVVHDAYERSLSAVQFLRQKKGDKAPIDFYKALGAAPIGPGDTAVRVDQALASCCGYDVRSFEHDWGEGRKNAS